MADCSTPTLSVPDLDCFSDPRVWAAALVAEVQNAINHLVGCIVDFEYPQCDICVMKDNLLGCPLSANMIDFSAVTWGTTGAQGRLAYPPSLSNYQFRVGTGATTTPISTNTTSQAVVFAPGFDNTCDFVVVVPTSTFESDPGGCDGSHIHKLYNVWITTKNKNGFTAFFQGDETGCSVKINFMYLAMGT